MHKSLSALVLVLGATAGVSNAGQSMQPGFYWHEPEGVSLQISDAKSGVICGDPPGEYSICELAHRLTVSGSQRCADAKGKEYFCTRYGYEFDYTGAVPGEALTCSVERRHASQASNFDYSRTLDAESGTFRLPAWTDFRSVDKRYLISEVHECSIRGTLFATIEYILVHPAGVGPAAGAGAGTPTTGSAAGNAAPPADPDPVIDEPFIEQVPQSCKDLTGFGVAELLQAENVQAGFGNEHVPNLQSQCSYSTTGPAPRSVSFLYKFMPYAMFDVDNLDPMQLTFNATFTGGGTPPTATLTEPGKITFVFETPVRTTLLVATGIQGPPSGGGNPRELVAFLYLDDPTREHADRLEVLLDIARDRVIAWR